MGPRGDADNLLPILDLYNHLLKTGEWPAELLLGPCIVHPVCKRDGLCLKTNARPITILETLQAGLTRIFMKRLKTILAAHPVWDASQFAFLPVDIAKQFRHKFIDS